VKPKLVSKKSIEEIDVGVFKDIQIHFPGDVYILAVWIAMSDRAKSTTTTEPHTILVSLDGNGGWRKYLGLSKSAVSGAPTRGQKLIVDQSLSLKD